MAFLFTALSIQIFADDNVRKRYSSIDELVSGGSVAVSIMGTGGHEGECIYMLLTNPSSDTSYIRIEPGRTFSSLDTSVQDILITREELLILAPGEERNLSIFGFCSQASCASPDSAEMFDVGR
jgi:hypothetical protein